MIEFYGMMTVNLTVFMKMLTQGSEVKFVTAIYTKFHAGLLRRRLEICPTQVKWNKKCFFSASGRLLNLSDMAHVFIIDHTVLPVTKHERTGLSLVR